MEDNVMSDKLMLFVSLALILGAMKDGAVAFFIIVMVVLTLGGFFG